MITSSPTRRCRWRFPRSGDRTSKLSIEGWDAVIGHVLEDDVLWPLFERALEVRLDAESAVVKGGDFQPDNDPQSVAEALGRFISKIEG